MAMQKQQKEIWIRLALGLLLNLVLFHFVPHELVGWSSKQREIWVTFISGSLAVAIWGCVIPVFWRGKPWQAPLAFVLIFFLPGMAILSIFATIISNWSD